jgi:O-antigen/teichoic acid export membrane protein
MTLVSADAATAYGGSRKRSVIQTRRRATPIRALEWFRTHSELSVRYLVENVSISGASQLRSFVVGAAAGLAAVGYVRASEILMGPFIVVLMGISQVAVPGASRVFHKESTHLARFLFSFSVGLRP